MHPIQATHFGNPSSKITQIQVRAIWKQQVTTALRAIARSNPPSAQYITRRYESILARIGAKRGKLIQKIVIAQLQNIH